MHRNGLAFIRTVEGGEGGDPGAGGNNEQPAGEGGNGGKAPFEPITTQEDLEKAISVRVSREREKYADYKDLKAKAKAYDEQQDAQKTETQKLTDQMAKLAEERDTALRASLRDRIATRHGISEDDAELFLTGSDEDTLTKQAKRLEGREADRRKNGNHVPSAGRRPQSGSNDEQDERAAVHGLFAQQ